MTHPPIAARPTDSDVEFQLDHTTLCRLHGARSLEALRGVAASALETLTGSGSAAILVFENMNGATVEMTFGATCPLSVGAIVELDAWSDERCQTTPLTYSEERIGYLRWQLGDPPPANAKAAIETFCDHFTVAFVNLRLNSQALETTDQYCASLQAFEEGVVLFQETNPDAIGARFLALAAQLLDTKVAALLLLDKADDSSSPLRIAQVQGMPEMFVEALMSEDDTWWPNRVLRESTGVLERDPDTGALGDLRADAAPDLMHNIVHIPLRYHGIDVGVALGFNVQSDAQLNLRLERGRRLGELGAALFHRLSLEQEALRSRELETQLSIASTIQARLIPTDAPAWPRVDCAWASQPAQFVGGDYVDMLELSGAPLLAVVADVSGHGIDSALLMASFRAAIRGLSSQMQIGELLNQLNMEVSREVGDTGMFITGAVLRFDENGTSCSFASAGHNACYVYRAQTKTIEELDSTGPSLGMFAGMTYDVTDLEVAAGDVVLLYTDGIVEAVDHKQDMYGDDRLKDLLIANGERSPDDILAAIQADLTEYVGAPGCDDDVSIAVIRIQDPADA